jgi:Phospholipase_D-nuclease N-terminal
MAAKKQWSDLSKRSQRLIIVGAVAETSLKVAALIDIKRRPASQIRGSKWIWAATVVLVNSFGGAPLAYFAFGRRRNQGLSPTDLGDSWS